MRLNELRQRVIEGARSALTVYNEQTWIEANTGQVKEMFCVALKDTPSPYKFHAEVEYEFGSLELSAIMDPNIYMQDEWEEAPSRVEPFMELGITIPLPRRLTGVDPLALMEGVNSAIHLTPKIIDEARTVSVGPHTDHEYSVDWFWTIQEDELFDLTLYEESFDRVRKAIEYLTKLEAASQSLGGNKEGSQAP